LLITDSLKASFKFINDLEISFKTVHTTCEHCSISDCEHRVAAPKYIDKRAKEKGLAEELGRL
jgi:hypothetical protein